MDYSGRLNVVKTTTQSHLESLKPFWVTSFGPTLIENYQTAVKYDKNEQVHPRTAIGQTDKPNEFLIVVVDGRSNSSRGVTLYELANIFKEKGVRVAYNLDGGGSSTLVFKGNVINKPSDITGPRKVVDSLFIRNIK